MKRFPTLLTLGLCGLLLPDYAAQTTPLPVPEVKAWRKTSSGTEKTLSAVLEDQSIRFGSKTLRMTPDGKVECLTPDSGVLFSGGACFFLKINGASQWGWQKRSFDEKKSKFRREGRKYIWDLWYQDKDIPSFNGLKQVLEVLPDDRISISYQFNMPAASGKYQFKPWTFVFTLPGGNWLDQTALLDGTGKKLNAAIKTYAPHWKAKEFDWLFGNNSPAKKFAVQAVRGKAGSPAIMYRVMDKKPEFIVFFNHGSQSGPWYQFFLDLRKGTDSAGRDIRGGVDFKAQENLLLPDNRHKNLVGNASFERGLEGWVSQFFNQDEHWDWEPFRLDEKVAYDGKNSLRMNTRKKVVWPSENVNIGPINIIAEPGIYTLSFHAKCEPGKKSAIYAWIPSFHIPFGVWRPINKMKARWNFTLTPEWKRYQANFEVVPGQPLIYVGFYAGDTSGSGYVWLDAVQVEKGNKATTFEPPPAEGRLITSDPDNFISSKAKIDGKFRITTAKPEMSGTVRITVKNFFGEILLDLTRKFRSGKDRTAELALPLDDLHGLGVFVVKADYTMDDGSSDYDIRRYAKIEFLDGPRSNKTFYGIDYSNTAKNSWFIPTLKRWQKLGVGAKHHIGSWRKDIYDYYVKYDITPSNATMLSYMRGKGGDPRVKHFFILDAPNRPRTIPDLNDPRILVRDFYLDSNGTITPEYLAKMKQAAKTVASKYKHIKLWALGGELTCKMPNDWWGKGSSDRDVARKVALLLKAFTEGVREGNPEAKVYQDDPANMAPRSGIAETDLLLQECNKLGVRFDVIGIHPYRFSPENPDTDSDAAKFMEVLKKNGYGDTPVIWPEGMHWGPFNIPQWGTKSSSAQGPPLTWWRGMLSYDMGWTEKKSAAWYTRAWLVALKYSRQVKGATSGCVGSNCYMDVMLTPYASQLVTNTLCSIFENVQFRKDVRFAPYIRTYIFEDAQKRPIAAVWCHKEEVDDGSADAPVVAADFGSSLESIRDMMNTTRSFTPGKTEFTVSSFPLFFRGRPDTLKQMISAFEKAELVSGMAIPQLALSVGPADRKNLKITVQNYISKEFAGTLNGKSIVVPPSGQAARVQPLKQPLRTDAIVKETGDVTLKQNTGKEYQFRYELNAFAVRKVPANATVDTLDWNSLPKIPVTRTLRNKNRVSGFFRMGWNTAGIFIEAAVKDAKFVHVEYEKPDGRWQNDCLQLYFDTLANARLRVKDGYDEDDYDYAVFPNSKGTSAQVYRYQTVDPQLGLATQAPPDHTFAPDIPCRFSNKNGVLTYRVFFPAKYLLPMKLEKGWAFGFGLYADDSNEPGKVDDALTIATDGKSCFNRPQFWPTAILTE